MHGKYLINVQILRFFAATLVVIAHAGVALGEAAARSGRTFQIPTPFDWGLGVDTFFIISGFIMYYMMHDRFGEPGAPLGFLRRRLIRIVPLYWICTTLTLASIVFAGELVHKNALDPGHIAASYAFIPWLRAHDGLFPFPLLSLGWTLNYEMFFYIVFAVALLAPRRVGIAALTGFFAVLMIVAGMAPDRLWLLKFWGGSMIGEFLLGIALASAHLGGRRTSLPVAAASVVAGLLLAVIFYQTRAYEHMSRLVTGGLPAILIAGTVTLAPAANIKNQVMRLLAIGGDASYALYLTHPFATKVVAVVGVKAGLPLPLVYASAIVASIAAAVATHYAVEKPIGAWLSRIGAPRPAQSAAE
jgi:peptidoglycan/LPS O-acetylase OafA/YrhL